MRFFFFPSANLCASVPLCLCVKSQRRGTAKLVSTLLFFMIFLITGCQTPKSDWSKNWFGFGAPRVQESKFAVPARMAVLWSPAMLNQAAQTGKKMVTIYRFKDQG